jgi:hypothetical protein
VPVLVDCVRRLKPPRPVQGLQQIRKDALAIRNAVDGLRNLRNGFNRGVLRVAHQATSKIDSNNGAKEIFFAVSHEVESCGKAAKFSVSAETFCVDRM